MYFSKVVKKCNTGSTVYNSIDYFPNGVSVLFFLPLLLFSPPEKKKKEKKSVPCLYLSENLAVMLTFMMMVYEKYGIHKSRKMTNDCDKFFGQVF